MADPNTQPPLAEARWLWRRLYVFAATLVLWRLLASIIARTTPEGLPRIADGLMSLLALTLVLYLVAPTAQQLVALLANLRLRLADGGPR
jgi:predicted membrane channel-forming protein YqfA (hemolysin III family)